MYFSKDTKSLHQATRIYRTVESVRRYGTSEHGARRAAKTEKFCGLAELGWRSSAGGHAHSSPELLLLLLRHHDGSLHDLGGEELV